MARDKKTERLIRRRLRVRGRVQGVGFRPAVYRLAVELGLPGVVGNDSQGAFIELEGVEEDLTRFTGRLMQELPPLAAIDCIDQDDVPPVGEEQFRIVRSETLAEQRAEISPDVATCSDCLRELGNPGDRRHGYAFTNCTNCGPRYSIVQGIPYDRCNTTMNKFPMCPECNREYDDPLDRRFHAQPNACPACGPHVWLRDKDGVECQEDAIERCRQLLLDGRIVAIKGLGGFHLACRADRDDVVKRLRNRKKRDGKPFALMVSSIAQALTVAKFDKTACEALQSWRAPIVLAPKLSRAKLAAGVAPGCSGVGVMLPYTPLHHMLFNDALPPLVMTSANPSDEPLCSDNDEAINRLNSIADAFLLHDRDIERKVDDSVLIQMTTAADGKIVVPLRRSRGYVPESIRLPIDVDRPVLAVGGDLKSVACLAFEDRAVLSEHLGELSNPASYRNFIAAIDRLRTILDLEPAAVVCDLHPMYRSTRFARGLGLPVVEVQHHHAHIEGCKAENGLKGPTLGLAADGTGYGDDGAVWGCELMLCDGAHYQRLGHLRYFPLVGGDLAARETWRPAAGLLFDTYGDEWMDMFDFGEIPPQTLQLVGNKLAADHGGVLTSSLGRLFDAVAFISGISRRNDFEAAAPMALEAAADSFNGVVRPLDFAVSNVGGRVELDARPLIRDLVARRAGGEGAASLAAAFHETLAAMLCRGLVQLARVHGVTSVALSGGCFLNAILLRKLTEALATEELRPYIHRLTPPGDGGLALGQIAVAIHRLRQEVQPDSSE